LKKCSPRQGSSPSDLARQRQRKGRFKSCLVQSERYLLSVMRYIELNPVRAAMVQAPQDYRWSSMHTHLARAPTCSSRPARPTSRWEATQTNAPTPTSNG
jgi:hypothetical protein